MTIAYRLNGALLPFESVRFNPDAEAAFPSAAWYCEPMVAGVIIEDQSGSLDLTGWSTFTVEETACSKPRIFTGWIAGKEISRGRDSNRAGTARVWNCDIIDQNALFSFEVFRSTAASVRPAETDVERIQAMIASHAMAGTPIYDNGRLSTDDPVDIGAANFVTQFPAEMAVSTAGSCTKNVYAYWDDSADQISIHYDAIGAGPAATISFSNVATDVNETTVFAPLRDAVLSQDPYSLYTGFLMGWVGGYTYQRNETLIDALSPTEFSPLNFLRDQFYSTSRIGLSSTAAAYTARYLAEAGVEKVTLRFSAILPASVVNLAHAGDVVTVKFSHLPGFTSATPVSIIRRSVRPVDDHDSLYEVSFECADFVGAAPGGGGTGGFPHPPSSAGPVQFKYDAASVGFASVTLDFTPTPGNTLILWSMSEGGVDTASGIFPDFTRIESLVSYPDVIGTDEGEMFYRVVEPGDGVTYANIGAGIGSQTNHIAVGEWEGLGALIDSDSVSMGIGPTPSVPFPVGTVTTPGRAVLFALGGFGDDNPSGSETLDPVELTELFDTSASSPWWSGAWGQVTAGTHPITFVMVRPGAEDGSAGIVAAFELEAATPPLPGQPVNNETPTPPPDGSETDFATENPFADGSLRVLCNGIDVTAQVSDSDADAGTFTLDFAPWPTDVLTTYYQGHP